MITIVRWQDVVDDTSFLDAWRELDERALEPNPFFAPSMLLSAARHLEGGERVSLVVDRDADGLHFLLPVVDALPGDVAPIGTRLSVHGVGVTGLRTWLHAYCFMGTPLLDAAEDPVALWRRVLNGLRRTGRRPWCEVPMLVEHGPVARALASALRDVRGTVREELGPRGIVLRRAEETYLDDWISKKNRANLARRQRQLAGQVGRLECVDRAERAEAIDTALEGFLALEARSWKGANHSAMATRDHHAAFFREALSGFAQDKRLVLLSLESAEEQVLAQSIVLRAGSEEFGFKRAYDPEYSRYSPGSLLDLEMLHRFHRGAATRLDTCSYPGVVTHDVFGDRQTMITVVMPTSRMGRLVVRRLWPVLHALRDRVRHTALGARINAWRHPGGRRTGTPSERAPVTEAR